MPANIGDHDPEPPPPDRDSLKSDDRDQPQLENWGGSHDVTKDSPFHHTPFDSPNAATHRSVRGDEAAGADTISADTNALRQAAANIDGLIGPVRDAVSMLAGINTRPGAFSNAFALRTEVDGTLKNGLTNAGNKLQEALVDIRNGLQKLAVDYGSKMEWDEMTAKDLQKALSELDGDLQAILGGGGKPA